jgi:hypothetical protein
MPSSIYTRRIPELAPTHPLAGRTGRHVRHDPRSKRYPHRRTGGPLVSVRHQRHIPILNQGSLGSCTGNATEGALGCSPFFESLAGNPAQPSTTDANADEQQAVSLYSAATALDDYDGAYPPVDTGSDGLSVAKAAQAAGLISGYTHCFSIDDVLDALGTQPVITGVNWYSSFDTPDENGIVTLPRKATVRGGHEFVLTEIDADRELIGADNSWDLTWGLQGRFYIPFAVYERLLSEEGDATVFVPLDQPAPQPIPDPGQDDAELAGCLSKLLPVAQRWLNKRGS